MPATIGTVANLGDAGQVLAVGSRAVASLSTGSVSAEDRSVELTDGTDLDGLLAVTMPSLSPSADGGPVLDQYGQVVGITLNLAPADSSDEPLTFAVPIDSVSRLVPQIINGSRLTHPWLGISDADDVPSVMARRARVARRGPGRFGLPLQPGRPRRHAPERHHHLVERSGRNVDRPVDGADERLRSRLPGRPHLCARRAYGSNHGPYG